MRVGSLDFYDVPLLNRDLAGKDNPGKKRQFSVEVEDPEVRAQLARDGVTLWVPRNNPEATPRLNVVYDNRFNNVRVVLVDSDGNALRLGENAIDILDDAWIKGADMHIDISRYPKTGGGEATTAFVKTMVVTLMSDEEKAAIQAELDVDPIMRKHSMYF